MDNAAFANGLTRQDALAMGDGANDLAMIEAAGLGLAVHAKPIVADAADAEIDVTDLTAALYFRAIRTVRSSGAIRLATHLDIDGLKQGRA